MPRPLADLIAAAARAGVVFAAAGETLSVSGPAEAAGLGRELLGRKPEVLAHLAACHWDTAAAVRLMEAADAAVERHGCRGADPAIRAAAARACEAYRRRDAEGLARACGEVARLAAAVDSWTPSCSTRTSGVRRGRPAGSGGRPRRAADRRPARVGVRTAGAAGEFARG